MRQIDQALRERGLRVWFDERELVPGQPWIPELERLIQTVRTVAVFVGENGIGPWEQPEIEGALIESIDRGIPVIPVRLPDAPADLKLPLFLKRYTWVDLRGGITPDGIDRLVWGITGQKSDSGSAPLSPGPFIHNLPYLSIGRLLKGRDKELKALAVSVESPKRATAIVQQALCGLGGIGKTRLAVEYVWRYRARYTAAFFIRADSPDSLRAGLALLAGPTLLNLPERTQPAEEEIVGAVLKRLREQSGWLLILDNVDTDDAASAIGKILPILTTGHVLITSRLRNWPPEIVSQSLETLESEEATKFLLQRTEKDRPKEDNASELACQLTGLLGGLPLALEQAAAFISRRQMSFKEYLDTWEQERTKVLEWYDERIMKYPASVAVTWQRTFDRLDPTAGAILRLCAYLSPDPIPVEMFEFGREIVADSIRKLYSERDSPWYKSIISRFRLALAFRETKQPQDIEESLSDLAAFSLIAVHEDTFTVHRMVQEVIRSRIPEERQRDWIELSSRLVDVDARRAIGHPSNVQTWPVWDALRPHIAEVIRYADGVGLLNPTARLMSNLGLLLHAKGLYQEAEPITRRALEIDLNALGENHPTVAIGLNNLASVLSDMNRLSEAESLVRRALDIDQKALGQHHQNVARTLNNLAQVLRRENRLAEAEPLMRRALDIDQGIFDEHHPNIARDLHNLAELLRATNRLSEAEPLVRRALEIQNALDENHPNVAVTLNNLAGLLQAMNRLAEAEPLIRQALDIDQNALGENHPYVARDLNNLAGLLSATNRLSEAEPLMRRAFDIFERSLGPDHPDTQLARRGVELLLQKIAEQANPPAPIDA